MQRHATPAASTPPARIDHLSVRSDPHALGTWLLQMGFDFWIGHVYNRVAVVPENHRIAPRTLIASNHQRDVDGPMLGTVMVRRRGLHFRWPLPYFATREDLFRPGILSRLTVHWPRMISTALGHISLAWFFPLGHTEPIRRVREFTLGEALQALIDAGHGDTDCAFLLNTRGRRELGVDANTSLRDALASAPSAMLEHYWGLRRLTRSARQWLLPAFRAAIDAQLEHFTRRLDCGYSVYFAPEGTISMDGHFGRIRAGFFRLVHMAASPPWILPVALAYDTLGPGRSRVVVRIGASFRADVSQDRRAFDENLRQAIQSLVSVTPSHLLARFLLHGPPSFTQDEFTDWLARVLAALRAADRSLDPLFADGGVDAIANARLRWLEHQCLIVRRGSSFDNACQRDTAPGWRTPAGIARYLDNQLADLSPETDRVPPC